MRIMVVGLGSIGCRHIKNLKMIDGNIEIAVLRQHSKEAVNGDLKDLVDNVFFEQEEALAWRPDVAFITNPAPFHIKTALSFAGIKSHLFIEKPLSNATDDIEALLKECREQKIVLMIGYVLRFFEPIRRLKNAVENGKIGRVLSIRATVGRYLPEWRPNTDYRSNVSARQELGGGVVFELSHELDYVRWIAGEVKEVSACIDKISDFDIDVEDVAEMNLRFENKAIGNIHLNMVDHARHRSCRIVGTDGTLTWDSHDVNSARLFSTQTQAWTDLWQEPSFDYNQMFIAELKHFFECINKGSEPLTNGSDGRRIVEIALAAKRSAREGATVKL